MPVLSTLVATAGVVATSGVHERGSVSSVVVRILATVLVAWLVLLGVSLAAHMTSQVAREQASRARIAAGTPTMLDVLTLMRDTMDATGAPFWPQRRLLSDPLVRGNAQPADALLLVAWVQARQPLPRLITFRQAGFTEDQIAKHASGVAFIDPDTAQTLAALRF